MKQIMKAAVLATASTLANFAAAAGLEGTYDGVVENSSGVPCQISLSHFREMSGGCQGDCVSTRQVYDYEIRVGTTKVDSLAPFNWATAQESSLSAVYGANAFDSNLNRPTYLREDLAVALPTAGQAGTIQLRSLKHVYQYQPDGTLALVRTDTVNDLSCANLIRR